MHQLTVRQIPTALPALSSKAPRLHGSDYFGTATAGGGHIRVGLPRSAGHRRGGRKRRGRVNRGRAPAWGFTRLTLFAPFLCELEGVPPPRVPCNLCGCSHE